MGIAKQGPKWLDKEAKEEWRRVVEKLGLNLTSLDECILAMYCSAYSTCQKAKRAIGIE